MLYDSPESQEEEERFAKLLKQVRNMDKAAIDDAIQSINNMVPLYNRLLTQKDRMPEEDKFVKEFPEILDQLSTFLKDARSILDESLTRQANAIYEKVKRMAEKGDEKAKEAYEDLKPFYQDALKGKLGTN